VTENVASVVSVFRWAAAISSSLRATEGSLTALRPWLWVM